MKKITTSAQKTVDLDLKTALEKLRKAVQADEGIKFGECKAPFFKK